MTTIINGNFQQQDKAQQAVAELVSAGFAADQTATFFVNPPGQHDRYPIGGDEDESPGTEDAPGGAVSGAAIGGAVGIAVGLATAPVLGPGAAVAGAGAGAYVGSLYGTLGKIDDTHQPAAGGVRHSDAPRKSGMLVAVSAPDLAQQDSALRILRAHGATDSEQTEGTIVAGNWIDFDPLTPVKPVTG